MSAQRAGLLLVTGVLALGAASVDRPTPPVAPRSCGVALGLFASDPDYDYGPMLAEIASHGATDVLLSVHWVQDTVHSSHLGPRPGLAPSDAALLRSLGQAHDLGLRVSLMPVVHVQQRGPGAWRGTLQPEDRAAWFADYEALLLRQAEIAGAFHVERLVVGSELSSLEADEARWRPLIAAVRTRTDSRLSWSANWDRFEQLPFWDALDEVGVSAWFELGEDPEASWDAPAARLRAIGKKTRKPVFLTEIGYPARSSAALRPWDHAGPAAPDPALQARLLDLFFRRFADERAIEGAFVWNWFGHGGSLDAGYSPRGRPAAAVMKRHFASWCGPRA